MTNIEIIKMLINALDTNGVSEEANKQAALALLDNLKVALKKDMAAPEKVDKQNKETKSVSNRGRKATIDWSKVEALKEAGWTYQAIADEMDCNLSTIGKHFMKGGA